MKTFAAAGIRKNPRKEKVIWSHVGEGEKLDELLLKEIFIFVKERISVTSWDSYSSPPLISVITEGRQMKKGVYRSKILSEVAD